MSLLLTIYNNPAWETFVSLSGLPSTSEAAAPVSSGAAILRVTQSLSSVSDLLSNLSHGQRLWLAIVQAEHYLANLLESGETLAEAAKTWEHLTNGLLALQRQQRKKLQLFNIHQALTQPSQFRLLLSPEIKISDYPKHPTTSSLALLAASQYVAQRHEISALNARLQASVLPLCENEKLALDIDEILSQNHVNDAHDLKLKAISEERDLILSQLHVVQEQLEQCYISLQMAQQDNKHTTLAYNKQYSKELKKLESELRKSKAKAANAEFTAKLLQQKLDKLKGSISWKAAAPVRAFGYLVRKKDPTHEKLIQDIGILLSSEYFDVDWYLRTYPDVAEGKANPAEHYLLHGATEGRLPGPLFDGNWYLRHYPDVAAANMNPLLHFILHGQQEGRSSSPILLTNGSQENGE